MSDHTTALREALANVMEPLRKELAAIDQEIAELEAQLTELRAARREGSRALALLDPSSVAKKPAPKTAEPSTSVAAETLNAIEAWLREHRDEIDGNGGFSTSALLREHGYDLTSEATLSNALRWLHHSGVIRLDHKGQGGAKFFKLVGQ